MFNREYHRRAAKQALQQVGAGLVQDNSGFYRPVKRPDPKAKRALQHPLAAQQLEFNFPEEKRPLADLFPEAYA